MILFGEVGQSVNNRVVRHGQGTEEKETSFCKMVYSISLSSYLARPEYRDRDPIIKIDTQGAEWLIWRGMQPLPDRRIAMVMEFMPWALRQFGDPADFLRDLLEHFHLFDLGHARDRFIAISADAVPKTMARTDVPPHWTDLLCLSRKLPSAGKLIERISSSQLWR
jgi:hypothetical protein